MGESGEKGFKGISGLTSELDLVALKASMHRQSVRHRVNGTDASSASSESQTSTDRTKPQKTGRESSKKSNGDSKSQAQDGMAIGIAVALVILVILGIWLLVDVKKEGSPTSPREEVVVYSESFHVTATVLNVRSTPSTDSPVIAKLSKGETVYGSWSTQAKKNGWRQIKFGDRTGWVSTSYLKRGTAEQAKIEQCKADATRPSTGQILNRNGSGHHTIVVRNGPNGDIIAKLKDKGGNEIVSFYVRENETATVKTIPEGYFKFQFATGKYYSASCGGKFMEGMRVSEDPEYAHYKTTNSGYTRYSSIMQYTLNQVRGGNLKMKSVPPGRF